MNLDQLKGGIYGLLIGDALGVPYEFKDPSNIPSFKKIDMIPPQGFSRTWSSVPVGTWSDDGAQALTLLQVLSLEEMLNPRLFSNGLRNWNELGAMTPDGIVFDIGNQTAAALSAIERFVQVPNNEHTNGNGSLMRCLPVAFFGGKGAKWKGTVARNAMSQSRVTHPHIRSQLACALYSFVAFYLINGSDIEEAISLAKADMNEVDDESAAEVKLILEGEDKRLQGTGYVVDSLWSALHCVRTSKSYAETVKRAVMFGNDTDTTACIAGGLAGIIYGMEGIPVKWLALLKGKEIVDPLIDKAWESIEARIESDQRFRDALTRISESGNFTVEKSIEAMKEAKLRNSDG